MKVQMCESCNFYQKLCNAFRNSYSQLCTLINLYYQTKGKKLCYSMQKP